MKVYKRVPRGGHSFEVDYEELDGVYLTVEEIRELDEALTEMDNWLGFPVIVAKNILKIGRILESKQWEKKN